METKASAPTDINALRNQLTGALVALSQTAGRSTKFVAAETDNAVYAGLSATSTSANPDESTLSALIDVLHKENARLASEAGCEEHADFNVASLESDPDNIASLKRMILAGVRGVAEYAGQARARGNESEDVNAFLRAALATYGEEGGTMGTLIPLFTTVGEVAYTALQMREEAPSKTAEQATGETARVKLCAEDAPNLAAQVASALEAGSIEQIFVVADNDADGASSTFFQELAGAAPKGSLFVVAGKNESLASVEGEKIGDIPRGFTVGETANIYSAVQFAVELMNHTNTGVNEMPLTFLVSSEDDESIASLAALLWIGLTNVYLVPKKPAIVSDGVLNFLSQAYSLKVATDAKACLEEVLGKEGAKQA